jgi:formylglycine-generating enzyme required for sulfatase activity
MEKKERNTLPIRQAMVDIVNIAGFSNQATLLLLKSSNGIDKLEGLKKILDERDAIAMDLGYEGHFKELQKTLKIDFPTGFSKNENPHVNIQKFEKEVFAQDFRLKKSDFMRVRSLSLQESPFRSCLGGSDCSTRTYFYKALDPNFIYFTMTDSSFHSSGHVTIVLGEAYNPVNGNLEKIAFIDKLQNIPNQKINLILHAVALSVAEQGYKLALPLEVGDHNGLSNMDGISHYVSTQILPQLVSVYKGFNPHENEFEQKFENAYSRAYLNLDVKIYDSIKLPSGSEIKPGKIFQEFFSDKNLNQNKLINDLLALRYSNNFNEIIKYISSGPVVAQLEKIKLFSTKDFEKDLQHFMAQKEWPMNVRKQAYLEYLILKSEQNKFYEVKAQNIEEPLRIQVASEIKQWIHSTDKRKNKFAKRMLSLWNQSLMQGEIIILQFLCDLKFFDVNEKNEQGFSPLMTAIHVEQRQTIEWLLKNPHLNLNLKDSMGNNEIEQARLLGKNNIADEIEKTLREKNIDLQSRVINVSERNQDGSPIIDFVNIYPGNFMMGDINKHKVTLTKPFEIMSVLTTNSMWKEIIDLANDEFETKSPLKTLPGKFAGDDIPVQFVSYVDVMSWLDMLNQLSLVDRADVQNKIAEIFPGHQLGMKYRLPTEAEWEFVARARGLNTGSFTFGNEIQLLGSYAWYTRNSNYQPQNVGLKKPNFINGKPIYDLHGNLWEWNTDWYEEILEGGVDPQGPLMGTTRLMRGGSYRYYESRMTLHFRRNESPEGKFEDVGFRIVRTKSN